MPTVDLSWGKCHFRTCGDGPPLLLIHSSSQTSQVFEPLMGTLSGYRMIAPDMPGFGTSAPLPDDASMEEIAGHLVQLLDHLGIVRAHLFGIHSGNKVGAALAAHWPERVGRVVLAGMTHSLVIDQEARNRAMLGYVAHKNASGDVDISVDKSADTSADTNTDRTTDGTAAKNAELGAADPPSPASAALPPQGVAGTYRANLAFDLAGTLERIAAPVLLIELVVRNEDHLGRQAMLLARRMRACTPLAIEGDDRKLLSDPPEELARLLRGFLG